jgi:seryl-tRNA synthetase
VEELQHKVNSTRVELKTLSHRNEELLSETKSLQGQLLSTTKQLRHAEEEQLQKTRKLSELTLQVDSLVQEKRELLKATGHQDKLEVFHQGTLPICSDFVSALEIYFDIKSQFSILR